MRNSCPSAVDDGIRFVRELRGHRYRDIPVLAQSDALAHEIAKSMDCVLCMLEFKECLRLRRCYRTVRLLRERNRSPSPAAAAVPEMPRKRKIVGLETVGSRRIDRAINPPFLEA